MEEDIFSVDADLTALKELAETLKENPDKEWLEYDGRKWIAEDYVVLKSKVKEKIKELEREFDFYAGREHFEWQDGEFDGEVCDDIALKIGVLKNLLREEQGR